LSYQDLIYAVEDGIATITLNRPARMNALSQPGD
jgi:enoyl-CoA hydratase/carnithine racemase